MVCGGTCGSYVADWGVGYVGGAQLTDIRCWRCNRKLGERQPNASGVIITCSRCGVKNVVGRERSVVA